MSGNLSRFGCQNGAKLGSKSERSHYAEIVKAVCIGMISSASSWLFVLIILLNRHFRSDDSLFVAPRFCY